MKIITSDKFGNSALIGEHLEKQFIVESSEMRRRFEVTQGLVRLLRIILFQEVLIASNSI